MSSSSSMSDFDMDMGDTGEAVEIKVQSSMQQSLFKSAAAAAEEEEIDPGIEEENMDDWEDDSKAPSIYKKPASHKSLQSSPKENRLKYYYLFDEKPTKKRQPCDVKERFYKHQEKVKDKIESLAKVLESKEVEECTFKPTVLNKSKARTLNEFFEHMEKYEEYKEKNKSNLLERQEKDFQEIKKKAKPKLCKNSLKIAAKIETNSKEKTEKLAKPKTIKSSTPEIFSYKPAINGKSQDLERLEKTYKVLYEDAVRRSSKSTEQDPSAPPIRISSKSNQVLLEKFKKDLELHFSYLDVEGKEHISYTKFTTLLYNMGFISRSSSKISKQKQLAVEIWALIGGEAQNLVNFANLQTVLTCVMNLKDPSIPSHSFPPNLGVIVEGVYCVRPEEVPKVHSKFLLLFEEKNFGRGKETEDVEESVIEPRKKKGTSYEDKLISEKSRLQEKWELIRQQKIVDEISSCTFQPHINRGPRTLPSNSDLNDSMMSQYSLFSEAKSTQKRNEVLYEYSKMFNQQKLNTSKHALDIEAQNEVKPCTFKPKIRKNPKFEDVPEAKGVKDMINRLRSSRKTKKTGEKKPFLFGLEKRSERILLDLSASSIESAKSDINKSFSSDVDKVNVRVTMPNGKKTWIRFNSGENKKGVLSKFMKSNSLTGKKGFKLKTQLREIFS